MLSDRPSTRRHFTDHPGSSLLQNFQHLRCPLPGRLHPGPPWPWGSSTDPQRGPPQSPPDIQFHFLQSTSLPPVTVLASCLMPPPHSEDREGGRGLAGTFPSSPKCPSCPARVSKQTSDVPRAMVGSALRWLSPWNFQASSLCPQAATPRSHCLCPCSAAMIALPQVGMCSRDPGSQEGHLLRISC